MSDLAHELRTPVHTLRAHVDGLEDGVVAVDPATWQVMRDQLDRLQRLGTDLAELSAAEEHTLDLDLQPADLVVIAAAAVDAAALQHQAKGVALRLRGRDDLPVLADAVRLQQVLGNLLDNALRHTRAGGSVEVVTARDRDHAVIDVVDTGDGIPAEEIDAIFDRFHRLDAARSRADGGSGLGLTIARAIVTDHHGALTVRSDGPGKGATFTIRLPLRT
jgi:two-component system, OmpR family, sensor histidine kinase BaeS